MNGVVLLIGLGNLGQRLALALAGCDAVTELIIAGRSANEHSALAALFASCGKARVRFAEFDASQHSAIKSLLLRERPNVVVQCASLLSPWHLSKREGSAAEAIQKAGFAAQLPAQLPLIKTMMEVAREIDFQGAVINCSYPDATHPILARLGLAPSIGTGNVSMIEARIKAVLREQESANGNGLNGSPLPSVRVLAHHAHVTSVVLSAPPSDTKSRPRVYLGEEGLRADNLAYSGPPMRSDPSLNALSAATGVSVILAMLPGATPLRVSAPGPLGLPGGYPVRIAGGKIALDLPPGLGLDEAIAFQELSARMDGIEAIADDGTVVFTEEARAALHSLDPRLCEPLHPDECVRRFRILQSLLSL